MKRKRHTNKKHRHARRSVNTEPKSLRSLQDSSDGLEELMAPLRDDEPDPRFEVTRMILDCSTYGTEEHPILQFRFNVRDTLSGTIHEHLTGILIAEPAISFGQPRESMSHPSFESEDRSVSEPAESTTNFSSEDVKEIIDQLLGQLIRVGGALLPAFSLVGAGENGPTLIGRGIKQAGETCDRNDPERRSVVWQASMPTRAK